MMGVVNVTPDSFSDGGRWLDLPSALDHALGLEAEGSQLLDIGGESSRSGAAPVSEQEECDRVLPLLEALRKVSAIPISIDTTKSGVARHALNAGADVINDISALTRDPEMASVVAAAGPVIRLPVGRDALQVGVRGCVGPAVVSGRGFEENHTTVAPRVGTHAEVLFASRRALRVGVRGELPITRMAWTVPDTGESTLEPPVRAGIVLGIGGAVRSGDGDAQVRP